MVILLLLLFLDRFRSFNACRFHGKKKNTLTVNYNISVIKLTDKIFLYSFVCVFTVGFGVIHDIRPFFYYYVMERKRKDIIYSR